ncbi:hypothetical protein MKEN_01265200 [Mycena kentingensis (nom. inval.)]|nr:hypothetical protein MKEN_01265200 [Mycena kentingensis (nom. inval.)]
MLLFLGVVVAVYSVVYLFVEPQNQCLQRAIIETKVAYADLALENGLATPALTAEVRRWTELANGTEIPGAGLLTQRAYETYVLARLLLIIMILRIQLWLV